MMEFLSLKPPNVANMQGLGHDFVIYCLRKPEMRAKPIVN